MVVISFHRENTESKREEPDVTELRNESIEVVKREEARSVMSMVLFEEGRQRCGSC